MKQLFNLFLVIFVCCFSHTNVTSQILDAHDFGFEGSSVADWTQIAGFTEDTTIKASGLKSMKAAMNYPQNSPKLQTYRNSNSSNGFFDLVEGDYTLSVMVYLEGDVPSELKISPTSAPFFPNLSLINIEKEKWVQLQSNFTVSAAEVKSDSWLAINFIGLPNSGSGTVYIDDIVIEAIELPFISKIETLDSNLLTLESKTYEVSLNIWLDNTTTISKFYTNLETPYHSILWDVSQIAKNQWVTLKQEVTFNEAINNSKFNIQVSSNPNLGGGTGTFYIDDIQFLDKSLSIEENPAVNNYQIFPNPTSLSFSINTPFASNVIIYNTLGKMVKNVAISNSNSVINTSELITGVYFVKIINQKDRTVKKLIIE